MHAFTRARETYVQALHFQLLIHPVDRFRQGYRKDVIEHVVFRGGNHGIDNQIALFALAGVEGHDFQAQTLLELRRIDVAHNEVCQVFLLFTMRGNDPDGRWIALCNQFTQMPQDEIRFRLVRVAVFLGYRRDLREAQHVFDGFAAYLDGLQLPVVEGVRGK